jgi:tRNA pseudouridine32 synthase/23S rRNA pseudouridine746 synthase
MIDCIIHRDDRLLVLEKPSGLLAVPGRGPDLQDCLAARVQRVMPTALVVHRLDRDTSGLMLMALDADAQRELSRQFEARTVRKAYQCVVRGGPAADEGLVDRPIARDPLRPPRYRIDAAAGRPSQTGWRSNRSRADRTRSGSTSPRSAIRSSAIHSTPTTSRWHRLPDCSCTRR